MGGRGSSPRSGLEFAPDDVEVVGEDAVAGVALITVIANVEAAVQSVMLQAVDVALHRAGLVAEGDKFFFVFCG